LLPVLTAGLLFRMTGESRPISIDGSGGAARRSTGTVFRTCKIFTRTSQGDSVQFHREVGVHREVQNAGPREAEATGPTPRRAVDINTQFVYRYLAASTRMSSAGNRRKAMKSIAALLGALIIAQGGAAVAQTCVGDCAGDEVVAVHELVLGVNIALGLDSVSSCSALDPNESGSVTATGKAVIAR